MSACLVCGSPGFTPVFRGSDRLYHTTAKQFSVVRCGQCGLLRLDPQPPPEELGDYYPNNYWFAPDQSAASRMEEAYRRLVLRDHVQFVSQALRSSTARGPLLDIGCGGGLFLGMTMFHVMEHLYDPRAYLRAARELLAPDGRLVVQVPNAASWQARVLGPAWNGADVPRHLYDFRDRDLVKILEAAGFEVLRRKYFSLRDNPAGLASSLAPSLDPMARRVRRVSESGRARLAKDLAYFALVVASLPFAAAEAAFNAGSTVMIEARPR